MRCWRTSRGHCSRRSPGSRRRLPSGRSTRAPRRSPRRACDPRLRGQPRHGLPRHQRRMDHRHVPDGAGRPGGARAATRADRRPGRRDPVRRGARARRDRHLRAAPRGRRRVRADQDGGARGGAGPQGGRVPARGDDRAGRRMGARTLYLLTNSGLRRGHPSLREEWLRTTTRRSWRATAPATTAATSRCATSAERFSRTGRPTARKSRQQT